MASAAADGGAAVGETGHKGGKRGTKEGRSSGYAYIERGEECGVSKLGVHASNGGRDSRH
jgi:hypothetical protein